MENELGKLNLREIIAIQDLQDDIDQDQDYDLILDLELLELD